MESNDISLTSTPDKDRHSLGVAEREQGFAVSGPGQQVIVFYANKQLQKHYKYRTEIRPLVDY